MRQLTNNLLAIVTALGLTAGIAVAQKKQPDKTPQVETPAVFRSGDPNPTADSIGNLKWFEIFSDQKLKDLITTAVDKNYDLRQAAIRIDLQRANLGLARSEQFPQVGAGGN